MRKITDFVQEVRDKGQGNACTKQSTDSTQSIASAQSMASAPSLHRPNTDLNTSVSGNNAQQACSAASRTALLGSPANTRITGAFSVESGYQSRVYGSKFGETTCWDIFAATADPSQPSAWMKSSASHQQPPEHAPVLDKLEFLHSQLDTFAASDVILNHFCLLGYSHRRQGGAASLLSSSLLLIR